MIKSNSTLATTDIYLPKQYPTIVELESLKYIVIEYKKTYDNPDLENVIEALYSISYLIKVTAKKSDEFHNYDYYPLEAIWNNNDNKLMIRQPDFLTQELLNEYIDVLVREKHNEYVKEYLKKMTLEIINEKKCIQMQHTGAQGTERSTVALMETYLQLNGYKRCNETIKNIYLCDLRKSEPAKLKRILRIEIEKR